MLKGIFTLNFMSRIKFSLSYVEHEKSLITSGLFFHCFCVVISVLFEPGHAYVADLKLAKHKCVLHRQCLICISAFVDQLSI